jgi:hypothetical protein
MSPGDDTNNPFGVGGVPGFDGRQPSDDELQKKTQPSNIGAGGALAAGTIIAALLAGITIRARELFSLVDDEGQVTVPVRSSCIASLQYNMDTHDMEITFVDGGVYYYSDVSNLEFLNFTNARSKGRHYNEYFRGREKYVQGKLKGGKLATGKR